MTTNYAEFWNEHTVPTEENGWTMKKLESRNDGNEIVDINVEKPSHYAVFPAMNTTSRELEAIRVIAASMTLDQFYGYCLGNSLKYRLRAGKKNDALQDLQKSDKYERLFNENKKLCGS